MTDKILIDGVDVGKCIFKTESILGSRILCNIFFEEYHEDKRYKQCYECVNCEFKQLQKAKDKCSNRLFRSKKDIILLCTTLINKALRFWEENEKLKGKIQLYEQQLNKIERIATYITEDRYDVGYNDILDKINYIKSIESVK